MSAGLRPGPRWGEHTALSQTTWLVGKRLAAPSFRIVSGAAVHDCKWRYIKWASFIFTFTLPKNSSSQS